MVTSGDGLYKDSYEDNIYTYRGSSPNNYVNFDDELWRIISINTSSDTIKITASDSIYNNAYDDEESRFGYNQYCNSSSGCNIYGSSNSLYDHNGNQITTLAREVNGTKYNLPGSESEMSNDLNRTYYNNMSSNARNMITESYYKAAPVSEDSSNDISTEINQASEALWKGKVALIDITEYIRASLNSNCINVNSATNGYCYRNNWMWYSMGGWTMSPISGSYSSTVWIIDGQEVSGGFGGASGINPVHPVVTLKSSVQITGGVGTGSDPYTLEI